MVKSGLDLLLRRKKQFRGKRVAVVANPSAIDSQYRFIVDVVNQEKCWQLVALFGPEHGLRAEKQDQELCGEFTDTATGLPVYSLYGDHLKPTPEMLSGIDVVFFDIQDVGSRYYTFIYTLAYVMEACVELPIQVVVLDRPNPINGIDVEGPILEPGFESFVGRYPIPIRHGMTMGELAFYFQKEMGIRCNLEVIQMKGWHRKYYYEQTRLPWVLPSPNMPTVDTALVYPGMCLLEGTNVSEGRGTTRPFEIFGAPWIDPYALCENVSRNSLPGLAMRPLYFTPTFNKFRGELCGGAQLHVTDRAAFRPVKTALCLIAAFLHLYPQHFRWKDPPYEFVHDRAPIDILFGNSWIRKQLEDGASPDSIEQRWQTTAGAFAAIRDRYLLY